MESYSETKKKKNLILSPSCTVCKSNQLQLAKICRLVETSGNFCQLVSKNLKKLCSLFLPLFTILMEPFKKVHLDLILTLKIGFVRCFLRKWSEIKIYSLHKISQLCVRAKCSTLFPLSLMTAKTASPTISDLVSSSLLSSLCPSCCSWLWCLRF